MKKISLLLLLFFHLISAKSQFLYLGVKGALNISNLNYNNNTNTNSKMGINVGFLAHIHASEKWALQPEVMYSTEGASTIIIPQGTVVTKLNYLHFPVLLQYSFTKGLRLQGGPQLSFLLRSATKTRNLVVNNNLYSSPSLSIPLGVSFVSHSGMGIDARYVFGLSNINNNINGPVIENNVLQVGVFYQIPSSKIIKHS